MKKISVIVRTFNNEKFIPLAVESVLNQDYPNFEIVIVNDGSTDSTLNILKTFNDPRIIIINQDNKGAFRSAYVGLENVTGEFITFLDGDDEFLPEILEKLSAPLQDSHYGFSYCDYLEINSEDNTQKIVSLTNIFNSLACGIMFRREVIEKVGFWKKEFLLPEYDFLIRVMKEYKGIHVKEPLYIYKRHGDSMTANKEFVEKAKKQLFDKYGFIKDFKEY